MSVQYSFNYSNSTAVERQPIHLTDVWTSIADLPANPDGEVSSIVNKTIVVFVATADPRVFIPATPTDFSQMVPANFFGGGGGSPGGSYIPILTDSAGLTIAYNPGVWVADSTLHCLEFCRPATDLGLRAPFTLEYWKYIGNTAADELNTRPNSQVLARLQSTALGAGTLVNFAQAGTLNTAVGYNAAASITFSDRNTCLGAYAGSLITDMPYPNTGSNTCVGVEAGGRIVTGAGNICIGDRAGFSIVGGTDNICIGADAPDGNNAVVIGGPASTIYVQGALCGRTQAVSGSGALAAPPAAYYLLSAAADVALTLPAAAGAAGALATFRRLAGSAGVVSLTAADPIYDTANAAVAGVSFPAATTQFQFMCDGAAWYQMA